MFGLFRRKRTAQPPNPVVALGDLRVALDLAIIKAAESGAWPEDIAGAAADAAAHARMRADAAAHERRARVPIVHHVAPRTSRLAELARRCRIAS